MRTNKQTKSIRILALDLGSPQGGKNATKKLQKEDFYYYGGELRRAMQVDAIELIGQNENHTVPLKYSEYTFVAAMSSFEKFASHIRN